MNEQNSNFNGITDEEIELLAKRSRKTKTLIVAIFAAALVIAIACAIIPGFFGEESEEQYETYPPVHPSLLHDTKEEGFDIFEYEEYLRYDRTVYLDDPRTGVCISVSEEEAAMQGEGFALLFELLGVLNRGDAEGYNALVCERLQVEDFTPQQLYDITVTRQTESRKGEGSRSYREYVFLVEYKIHENNGSYRNTVEPDACRPQYFVINDSEGRLLVQDIIDVIFSN